MMWGHFMMSALVCFWALALALAAEGQNCSKDAIGPEILTTGGRLAEVVARWSGARFSGIFLDSLLDGKPLREFAESTYERGPRHYARHATSPSFHDGLVDTSADGVRDFLRTCVSAVPATRGEDLHAGKDIKMARGGKLHKLPGHPRVTPAAVAEHVALGYSFVMMWTEYRSTVVAQLTEAFEATLGFHASANLYHTPGGNSAFSLHYDWCANRLHVHVRTLSSDWSWSCVSDIKFASSPQE